MQVNKVVPVDLTSAHVERLSVAWLTSSTKAMTCWYRWLRWRIQSLSFQARWPEQRFSSSVLGRQSVRVRHTNSLTVVLKVYSARERVHVRVQWP